MDDNQQSGNQLLDFQPGDARSVRFELNDETVIIEQTWDQEKIPARLALKFKLKTAQRFGIRVYIPTDCLNACAALNGQFLLGWFATNPQPKIPELQLSPCAEEGHAVSPLKPGRWQTVNFRWHPDDQLVFYLVRAASTDTNL